VEEKRVDADSETTSPETPETITVEIWEAKPNALFTEEMRSLIRFLRFSASVPCAECGRKRKTHWTMITPFHAHTFPKHSFALVESGKVHEGAQPVCRAHLLAPVFAEEEPPQTKEVALDDRETHAK
jgi:hypothetical protein